MSLMERDKEMKRIESGLSMLASNIVPEHKCDTDLCDNPLAHGTTGISYTLAARIIELLGDRPTATLYYFDEEAHDGAGFYYVDDEYPEEGSCGAFKTVDEAIAHAGCEYIVNVHESCKGH